MGRPGGRGEASTDRAAGGVNTYGSGDNAGVGGLGSGGDELSGAAGQGYPDDSGGDMNANAGGGGGGSGRIRINTWGAFSADGALSPARSSAAFSEGTPPIP